MKPIQACVFDAYGTLFDVHAPVRRHAETIGEQAEIVSQMWRTKQLEYTWLRSLMGRYVDFDQVTMDSLDYALAWFGVDPTAVRGPLLAAYQELDAYPEVPAVLDRLRAFGVPTAILSNGSPSMLAAAVGSAGLSGRLDAVFSVDDVGVYKPDPRVYQIAVDHLGVPADAVLFLSSNAWDAVGAASFGFQVVWVNRFGRPPEQLDPQPAHELADLGSLPDLIASIGSDGGSGPVRR